MQPPIRLLMLTCLAATLGAAISGNARAQRRPPNEAGTVGGTQESSRSSLPTMPGQAAFGAIGEIVRILEADPGTDWSKVDIEALRQHLIDMDEVVLHANIVQRAVDGGIQADVTGQGRTAASIKRVVLAQSRMLDMMPGYHAEAEATASGARVVIIAKHPGDARTVARIRGLGFAGLMTEGDHHVRHHIAIARGEAAPHAH